MTQNTTFSLTYLKMYTQVQKIFVRLRKLTPKVSNIVYTSLIKEGSEPIDYFTVFLRLDLT